MHANDHTRIGVDATVADSLSASNIDQVIDRTGRSVNAIFLTPQSAPYRMLCLDDPIVQLHALIIDGWKRVQAETTPTDWLNDHPHHAASMTMEPAVARMWPQSIDGLRTLRQQVFENFVRLRNSLKTTKRIYLIRTTEHSSRP